MRLTLLIGCFAMTLSTSWAARPVLFHDLWNYGDPAATQTTVWTEWVIDLTEFAGVDLTNVNTITIGFGTKNAAAAGSSGTMYFDDIRLYR